MYVIIQLDVKKITWAIILILAVGVGLTAFFSLRRGKLVTPISELIARPTPMPFVEMTIPYLRQRMYESVLGERTQIERGATYTSYTWLADDSCRRSAG